MSTTHPLALPAVAMEGQIGHWGNPDDSVSWLVDVRQPGRFTVQVEYACERDLGGSSFVIAVAGQELGMRSEETGSWRTYRTFPAGPVEVTSAGRQTVTVRPDPKTPWHAISLKSVTLVPAP